MNRRDERITEDIANKFAPEWFVFLERLFLFGTITYLYKKTQILLVVVIYLVSYAALFLNILSSIFKLPIQKFVPKSLAKRSDFFILFFSLVITVVIVSTVYYLLVDLINQLISQGLIR